MAPESDTSNSVLAEPEHKSGELPKEMKDILQQVKDNEIDGPTAMEKLLAYTVDSKSHQQVRDAVKQLEQQQGELQKDITKRLKRIEQVAGGGSRHYRGHFASEDDARAFGLAICGHVLGVQEFADALKSEHKEVFDSLGTKAFTTSNADAVIPETWVTTMVNLLETYGVFEPAAMTMPMPTDVLNYTKKTGRIGASPMTEGSALSSASPTLSAKTLTAKKWGAYTEVNNEVTEDAIIAIAEMIADDMAMSHAKAVDDAGFNGDGTASFNSVTGITNALASAQIKTGSGSSWSALTLPDHEEAVSYLSSRAFAGQQLAWYCSQQYYWLVMVRLMLEGGGVTAGEIEGRRRPLFMGYPVVFTDILPNSSGSSQISAIIGNLRLGARFGDRRAFSFRADPSFKFSSDQTAMLSTRRYAINIDGAGDGEVIAAVQTSA